MRDIDEAVSRLTAWVRDFGALNRVFADDVHVLVEEAKRLREDVELWYTATLDREEIIAEQDTEIAGLKLQLEGEAKARELTTKGMESQCELMDGLKQRVRKLETALRDLVNNFDGCCGFCDAELPCLSCRMRVDKAEEAIKP